MSRVHYTIDPNACGLSLTLLSRHDPCGRCGIVAGNHKGWQAAVNRGAVANVGWDDPPASRPPPPPVVPGAPVAPGRLYKCRHCGALNGPLTPENRAAARCRICLVSLEPTPAPQPATTATQKPPPDDSESGRKKRLARRLEAYRAEYQPGDTRRMLGDFIRLISKAVKF